MNMESALFRQQLHLGRVVICYEDLALKNIDTSPTDSYDILYVTYDEQFALDVCWNKVSKEFVIRAVQE